MWDVTCGFLSLTLPVCGPLVGQLEHARFAARETADLMELLARPASLLPLPTNILAAEMGGRGGVCLCWRGERGEGR